MHLQLVDLGDCKLTHHPVRWEGIIRTTIKQNEIHTHHIKIADSWRKPMETKCKNLRGRGTGPDECWFVVRDGVHCLPHCVKLSTKAYVLKFRCQCVKELWDATDTINPGRHWITCAIYLIIKHHDAKRICILTLYHASCLPIYLTYCRILHKSLHYFLRWELISHLIKIQLPPSGPCANKRFDKGFIVRQSR